MGMVSCPVFTHMCPQMTTCACEDTPTSRISLTHEATLNKVVGRATANALVLLSQTNGFYFPDEESILTLSQEADRQKILFKGAASALNLANKATVAGGRAKIHHTILNIDSDTVLVDPDNLIIYVDATLGDVTITMPSIVETEGYIYFIKKVDASANKVIIDGAGAETLDDLETRELLSQYDAITLSSDDTGWHII